MDSTGVHKMPTVLKRKGLQLSLQPFNYMARPARFERATAWFVARYSIQLSYGRFDW